MQTRSPQPNREINVFSKSKSPLETKIWQPISHILNRTPLQSIENLPSKRILESSPNKRVNDQVISKKIKHSPSSSKLCNFEDNCDYFQPTVQQLIDELWMIQKQLDFVKDFSSDGRRECDSIRKYLLNAPQKDIIINFDQIKEKVSKLQEQLTDWKQKDQLAKCSLCRKQAKQVTLGPCSHKILCIQCTSFVGSAITKCPTCFSHIMFTVVCCDV